MEANVFRRNVPSPGATSLADLWSFRELLRSLVVRNLKVKYQRSLLGFLWTLLNPLLTASVLIAVFSIILRFPLNNYWAFLISGYFVWMFVSQMLAAGTTILDEHAALRRSIAFPAELLILGGAIARFFEFSVAFGVAVVAIAVFHHGEFPAHFSVLPVLMILQFLLAVGLKMLIAVLAVFYHDVRHMISIVLLMLFYLTPVFYPLSFVPDNLQWVYVFNPFASLLGLFQAVLYEGRMPELDLFLKTTAWSVGFMIVGYAIFNRYKSLFAEIV